jgi:hypothetical protein
MKKAFINQILNATWIIGRPIFTEFMRWIILPAFAGASIFVAVIPPRSKEATQMMEDFQADYLYGDMC